MVQLAFAVGLMLALVLAVVLPSEGARGVVPSTTLTAAALVSQFTDKPPFTGSLDNLRERITEGCVTTTATKFDLDLHTGKLTAGASRNWGNSCSSTTWADSLVTTYYNVWYNTTDFEPVSGSYTFYMNLSLTYTLYLTYNGTVPCGHSSAGFIVAPYLVDHTTGFVTEFPASGGQYSNLKSDATPGKALVLDVTKKLSLKATNFVLLSADQYAVGVRMQFGAGGIYDNNIAMGVCNGYGAIYGAGASGSDGELLEIRMVPD